MRKLSSVPPTISDTNQHLQLLEKARNLRIRGIVLSRANKGADQMCSYCTVTAFVFVLVRIWFSHDVAHIFQYVHLNLHEIIENNVCILFQFLIKAVEKKSPDFVFYAPKIRINKLVSHVI